MNKSKTILSLIIICGMVFFAFFPSLKAGFVNWDDYAYVVENTHIKSLSWDNVKHMFTSFSLGGYTPLVFISYLFEYHLFHLNPVGYHLTNLALHVGNTLLAFWLVYLLSDKIWIAFITALLFGIHPVHVESVAWVSERKDVLYAFFFLTALISYLYYLQKRRLHYYFLAFLLFILSFLAKAMAITLPLVLFLLDYLVSRRGGKAKWFDKIPFLIGAGIFGVIAVAAHYAAGYKIERDIASVAHKGAIAAYAIFFYVHKIFMPRGLSCLYPYPETGSAFRDFSFLAIPLACIILALAGLFFRSLRRKTVFGTLFFLITLAPALQVLQVGKSLVADRYLYLPAIGIFFLIGAVFSWVYERGKGTKIISAALIIVLGLGMGALAFLSRRRAAVWKDSVTLWSDCLSKYPDVVAYNNRCAAYKDLGNFDKAIPDCTRALQLFSRYADAYNNRGLAYQAIGDFVRAFSDYNAALEIDPSMPEAYINRGIIQFNKGYKEKALSDFNRALQCDANSAKAYNSRGIVYQSKGELDKSITEFKKALQLNPDFAEAYLNLGASLYYQNKLEGALVEYGRAITLFPQFGLAYYNRGLVYHKQGKLEEALADYSSAIKYVPAYAKAYYNRGVLYLLKKDYAKSWEDVRKAASLGYKVDPQLITELRQAMKGQ